MVRSSKQDRCGVKVWLESCQGCGEGKQEQDQTSRNVRKRGWEDVQADDRVIHRPLAQRDKVRDDDGRYGLDAAAARALDGCSPSDVQGSHARFVHVNELRVSRVGADDSASGSECDRGLRLGCARAVSRVAPARVDGCAGGREGTVVKRCQREKTWKCRHSQLFSRREGR